MNQYDVAVIGGGVIGCAIARELSRYDLHICLIEKEEDVCSGTSKANSAIIHAGYDARPGSLKAEMNIQGNRMMDKLAKDLDFEFKRNGSLVLCFSEADTPKLMELYERGKQNGVPRMRILEREEVLEMEPDISRDVKRALYAPTGGIVCPFGMTIAFAESASINGVEFIFNTEVRGIKKQGKYYQIVTGQEEIRAEYIVNAAGVYADKIHNMVSKKKIHITPRRGEYFLLDKEAACCVKSTVFQLPGKYGKGILVTPTIHGNLLLGPTAVDQENKEDTSTTAEGLKEVREKAALSVDKIPFQKVITSFSGLRAHEDNDDFIIEEVADSEGFFDAAGIESPGLTSSPAIGIRIAEMVASRSGAKEKKDFQPYRKGFTRFASLTEEEKAELIRKNPAYGSVVCRCESITEGEIIEAINRPVGAVSLDGIKRRVRQGMGRCQAGFCTPRAMEILARERNVSEDSICKNKKGSEILMKEEGYDDQS